MILLIFISFISGVLTIFSPCIWSILPVVLSSSIKQGKLRSIGLVLGVVITYVIVTLTISYAVKQFQFNADIFRVFAAVLLGIAGATMALPFLSTIVEGMISRLTHGIRNNPASTGFGGGFITGVSLGLLWSPCTGPILTVVSTLAATSILNSTLISIIVSFAIGIAIPLFILSVSEQWLFSHHPFLSRFTSPVQRVFGLLMIVSAFLMYTNYDKVIASTVLANIPIELPFYSRFETVLQVQQELGKLQKVLPKNITPTNISGIQPTLLPTSSTHYTSTLPVIGLENQLMPMKWINTNGKTYTLSDLRGKVVLLDFWSFTCLACLPSIPLKKVWLQKYQSEGFEVISVHVPSTAEARSEENIISAIDRFKVTYPVGIDADLANFTSYRTQFLPSEYLIDIDGRIRHQQFESGHYDEMEKAIRELLRERNN